MRPLSSRPSLTLHAPSGQARVDLRMPDGSRKDLYLGRHGSREAKRRYRQLLRELPADEPKSEPLPKVERGQATVAILCTSYLVAPTQCAAMSANRLPHGIAA